MYSIWLNIVYSLYPFHGNSIKGIAGTKIIPRGQGDYQISVNMQGEKGQVILQNALFIPDVYYNLISILKLKNNKVIVVILSKHIKARLSLEDFSNNTLSRR